jgi:hypothetical protein
MKVISLFLSSLILLLLSGCNHGNSNLINPIIGDISFVEKFGFQPDNNTDNDLRISTHLQYVERLLRNKDVSLLSKELKEKRAQLLDLLHTYAVAGHFPKNYDFADQRKPCFIDKDKTICAVGYLIEQTAGRPVAEAINAEHQYDTVLEMDNENVDQWIASSGLTKTECAMIQPQYGPQGTQLRNNIKPAYAIGSAVLMGANVAFNTINVIDLSKSSANCTAPVLGLLAGAGQVTIGAIGFDSENDSGYRNDYGPSGQRTLSMINIGLGTSTILLSTWNLVRQKKVRNQRTSWNIFSFPAGNNQTGVGLSLSRKI